MQMPHATLVCMCARNSDLNKVRVGPGMRDVAEVFLGRSRWSPLATNGELTVDGTSLVNEHRHAWPVDVATENGQ